MARELKLFSETFEVAVSTTAKQFYIVKHTTTANTVTLTTAAGERALGIVQEPTSSGGYAEVLLAGISKLAHDGTLSPGLQFMASTAGLGTAASTAAGIYRLGTVLEAGSTVSGTLASVLWNLNGQSTN